MFHKTAIISIIVVTAYLFLTKWRATLTAFLFCAPRLTGKKFLHSWSIHRTTPIMIYEVSGTNHAPRHTSCYNVLIHCPHRMKALGRNQGETKKNQHIGKFWVA